MAPKKAVVLGLDGATFDLLLPRVERGHMPHLAALLARGAWGNLRSTTPPFSAQAWVSLATGHNQARHGVVDFWQRGADLSPGQRREFVDARQVHTETLWQTAGRAGLRVGVVNVPVTFPPSPVNGYLVSGFLTPQGRDDWAYPPGLRDEVLDLVPGYEPDPFDPLGSSYRQLEELVDWMEKHERVARHLAGSRPADLFFSVVQALDHLQHLFWDEVAGDSDREAYVALAERCYRLADEAIGHRAALAGDEATLFLVSDHGFGPARKWFHVNRFLQELGLLVLGAGGEGAAGTTATRLGLTPEKMRGLVRRLDVLGLRRWVGRLARVSLGRRLDERLTPPVDWGRTRAISGSPATEGIFINRDLVAAGDEYEALRRRLAAELLALRDPESGEAVVEAVHRREEIYDGPFLDQLPDLVFDLGRRPYLAGDSLTADRVLAPLPRDYLQGRHQPLGIFCAAGPNIRPAGRLEGPRIVDVMPTVLYALDLPIPEDVDGRPLLEIFDDDYRTAHPVRHAPPVRPGEGGDDPADGDGPSYDDDDLDEMQRRLQGLGYVS
ncbi:MAG: alkaline phosphatase family protein [Anaerolineae bacterium]|jgi:predicted AlkP superfamily phosphohydrolase/phosphomutase